MSIVDITKIAALVVTGLFGILALLVEFKDKDTKKTTRWGHFSLIGIIVSSGFSVISQVKESASKAADHEQAVLDMRRAVTPLEGGKSGFAWRGKCLRAQKMQLSLRP